MSDSLLIRKISPAQKLALKARAKQNNRSMEEEARQIMAAALKRFIQPETPPSFIERVRSAVRKHGGLSEPLELPGREDMARPSPLFN
jgi:hypothetical protein